MLPYLDAQAVHDTVDWTDQTVDGGGPPRASPKNVHLLTQPIPCFVCPADGDAQPWMNSYRLNQCQDLAVTRLAWLDETPRRFLEVTDGLSQTVLYSERLVGSEAGQDCRNPLTVDAQGPWLPDACVQAQLPTGAGASGDPYAGWTWLRGSDRQTRYSHLFPPNSRLCDCNSAIIAGHSLMSARSEHSGGVNVGFTDGHTKFVSNGIAVEVWRAIGTSHRGEPIQFE